MTDVREPPVLRRSRTPALGALDRGGAVLQRRLRDVTLSTVAVLVPAVGLNLWATVVAFDRFDPDDALLPTMSRSTTGTGVEDVSAWMAVCGIGVATVIVGHLAAQILIGERFGAPIGARSALGRTLRKLPALVWLWVLTHWWVPLVALLALSVPSADTAPVVFWWLVLGWFVSAFTLLAVPAMVGEGLGPWKAAARALRLARMRYGVCLVFVLLATVLAGGFLFGMATLAPLLEATGFVPFGGAAWIVQGILVQLGVLLVVPLVALATAQLYVEVRLDAEGLDVVVAADAAFGAGAVR